MSGKECCQQYEIDYKKVVQEIQETLYNHEKDLENKLQDEKSPIRYIELNAILNVTVQLRECIYNMFEYCKKPVEISDEKDIEKFKELIKE